MMFVYLIIIEGCHLYFLLKKVIRVCFGVERKLSRPKIKTNFILVNTPLPEKR